MTAGQIPIFVNGATVLATSGEALSVVLARHDPDLVATLMDSNGLVTDARGLPVDPDSPVHGGAIYRIKASARHHGSTDV
jgi:hypothetical protein